MPNRLATSSPGSRVPSMTSSTSSLLPKPRPQPAVMRRMDSSATSLTDTETPYTAGAGSKRPLLNDQFSLPPDIRQWGNDLSPALVEPDDELHAPEVNSKGFGRGNVFSNRGALNLGCLVLLLIGIVTLFAGYPTISYFTRTAQDSRGGFNLGGINGSGQVPSMPGNWGLIDLDTPQNAYTKPSRNGGEDMELIFSDEFNTDGRTFYPGDDPYWEAVDLHYWATNNMEWYDPAAITTQDGSLVVTLSQKETHGLQYQGGMMSTWNKFCFTGGYIEASVVLPGVNNILGLWPAIWTMGNLGRAGYGASLEGTWPYTYDECDVGTVANQTVNGKPAAATVNGDKSADGVLSYAPGQRLSRCTCPGESHPGPMHSDGTFVGRAAPEIDMFEAQVTGTPPTGQVSQSAQWAPYNDQYIWLNTTDNEAIYDPTITIINGYIGSAQQQATSFVTNTNPECYEGNGGCFSIYGFEYVPGFDNGYITWVADDKPAWTIKSGGLAADPKVEIAARPIPQEPMYILLNLGMSTNFGPVDVEHLPFPVHMKVDYIRVYQPKGTKNIGCDPENFPTASYINQYIEAYTNPNLTTWRDDFKQPFPKNKFLGQC